MQLKLEFEELGKEDGNSMHEGIKAPKHILFGSSAQVVWYGWKKIHEKTAERWDIRAKGGEQSHQSRFLACPIDGRTIYWDMEYKKSKLDFYVSVCKGVVIYKIWGICRTSSRGILLIEN